MLATVSPTIKKVQFLGGVFFLISFVLPAIQYKANFYADSESIWGYEWVEWSARFLFHSFSMLVPHPGYYEPWTLEFILGVSGFINVLAIGYLLANPKWRRRLAILICVLFLETWFAMSLNHFVPLVGHFLRVSGILLLLAPEVSAWEDGSAS